MCDFLILEFSTTEFLHSTRDYFFRIISCPHPNAILSLCFLLLSDFFKHFYNVPSVGPSGPLIKVLGALYAS